MSAAERRRRRRDGLPAGAFAIVGDGDDPDTWQFPHHRPFAAQRSSAAGTRRGKGGVEETVDWQLMTEAVAGLSPRGRLGRPSDLDPEKVIIAARHLAAHHVAAGRRLPDVLAALT